MAERDAPERIADRQTAAQKQELDTGTLTPTMKRRGYISPLIETDENYLNAFQGYARHKMYRTGVKLFAERLEQNLTELKMEYAAGTGRTSDYVNEIVYERKVRRVSKLPVRDHVRQWAPLLQIERLLTDTFIRRSCSCVAGRGTHDFVDLLRHELTSDPTATWYHVQLDAHHFFENINHELLKERIRTKIKDAKLLRFLDEFIDSFRQGLPLGVKISQILANFFLARFDHDAVRMFGIADDPEKMAYWRSRYVSDCLLTCRTEAQAAELAKGVEYLKAKFDGYARQPLRYLRFADNIVILHSDKTFLHLIAEMCIMVLSRDYFISVNRGWNVRPVWSGGIDVCGYVSYHTHRTLRKRNKRSLCRQVAKCKKKGLTPEETRLRCASRIGFATHANSRNLLRKLDVNMEKRLGKVIKGRRTNIPFKGLRFDQKRSFSDIVCRHEAQEEYYKIMLLDYTVEDSKMETEEYVTEVADADGEKRQERRTRPKKCLAIRYKRILRTDVQMSIEGEETESYTFEKERDSDGNPTTKDAEYYSYSGSAVLIDQAQNDFDKSDLPCPTVIREFTNKLNKKFYKFT
jgi:retron-type reverse transcriptase